MVRGRYCSLDKSVAILYIQVLAQGAYFPDLLSCVGVTRDRDIILQCTGEFDIWDDSNRYDPKTGSLLFREYVAKKLREHDWTEFRWRSH